MKHQQIIENFITEGSVGRGLFVKANENMLYSEIPWWYSLWEQSSVAGQWAPLAIRLRDGTLLVNGTILPRPMSRHQFHLLRRLDTAPAPAFGVVPFHVITAALTGGKIRNWNQKRLPIKRLQRDVGIVVPSSGERWREISEMDKHGHTETRWVHTLGDSVVRIRDRYYLSAVDETGLGWFGIYCLTELRTHRAPESLAEALQLLKPEGVREAEARGFNVRRQGEWFAIPTKLLTSELMRDVQRGFAVYCERHVLGRNGHHELEEAVIYRHGPNKGEVYARGVLRHTQGEHHDLDLGMIRWHLVMHNAAGQSYTLSGTKAQFD